MEFKVIFKDSFVTDLEGIVRSISQHNPSAAQKLGELIIGTAETLSFFPERFPRVRQRAGVRRFILKKHFKVFYRVNQTAQTVDVLRCWDAHREHDPAL